MLALIIYIKCLGIPFLNTEEKKHYKKNVYFLHMKHWINKLEI
jgi:hypothetical protein